MFQSPTIYTSKRCVRRNPNGLIYLRNLPKLPIAIECEYRKRKNNALNQTIHRVVYADGLLPVEPLYRSHFLVKDDYMDFTYVSWDFSTVPVSTGVVAHQFMVVLEIDIPPHLKRRVFDFILYFQKYDTMFKGMTSTDIMRLIPKYGKQMVDTFNFF